MVRRRQVFCERFARTGRGVESARFAGYAFPLQESNRLLRDPKIQAEIERLRSTKFAIAEELEATRALVAEAAVRLGRLAVNA